METSIEKSLIPKTVMELELSSNAVKGLKLLGYSSSVNDDCFVKLLEDAISVLTNNKTSSQSQLQSDGAKESYAALLSTLVEASRCDMDAESLAELLTETYNFPNHRSNKFATTYQKNKTKIQASLSNVQSQCLPHVVDVDWKLDYCVKSSSLDNVGEILYLIQFHTECPGNKFNNKKVFKKIQFTCNLEQLQDLALKLKGAVKQVRNIAESK